MTMTTDTPANPFGIGMDRMGSGTTWIPDAVALPSRHFAAGNWDLMLHGFAFAQYDKQSGPRGADQFGSLNWGMLMVSHELGGGRLHARTMLSLDAAGVSSEGYPLVLQTGETFRGEPLHDRQHPHDFFMELSALYERQLSDALGVSFYAAPSGEPALGPVAFMHRPSAMDNPAAGLGHHWQDATHVSFGVFTAGLFTRRWKAEGSIFNGRDPDENRWNFDLNTLDSYSGRLTFNPDSQWSVSAGYGLIRQPEASDAGHSIHRSVVSVQNGRRFGTDGQWATTFIWSANAHTDESGLSHSVLVESEAVLDERNTLFGRAELVQKSADDLVLTGAPGDFAKDRRFDVSSISLGYIRELASVRGATLGLGTVGAVYFVPEVLRAAYGSRTPLGAMVFVRLRALTRHSANPDATTGMGDHAMQHAAPASTDSAFAKVQVRGKTVMGVDQYTSQHVFEALPDGGRIVLVRDTTDVAGVQTIRAHLKLIADAFGRGDFALPGQVHDREVPGTRAMSARRAQITYMLEERAGGGAVRIRTSDLEAVRAVHAFLAFQRADHRAPDHEHRPQR